jgi:hypothetical protein
VPDIALGTLTEFVDNAGHIVEAVDPVPVICDADTGFGNATNVVRTVRAFERGGVAASTSKTRRAPNAAATSTASGPCPWPRWSARSGPRARPGAAPTSW